MTRAITVLVWDANRQIDAAAGRARERYLTMAPGQELVYAAKLAQAAAFVAAHALDAGATVPAYVAAEAAGSSTSAINAANAICGAAAAFHAGAGPDIEQARRAGKVAVLTAAAAVDRDGISAALAAALAALEGV